MQVARVELVMLAVSAVLSENRVVVPPVEEPHVNVGVALNVVVTLDAAAPVPFDGACQIAWVLSVAVSTLPLTGAVAALVSTVVVALFRALEIPEVRPVAVPVTLVITPDAGVPSAGVTSVGEVANTAAPLPVSSVIAAAKLADVEVPRNVATPVANPDTPVLMGKPVAFVSVPLVGVPSTGVTRVGLVALTTEPVPVFAVAANPLIRKEFPVAAVS